MAAKGIGEDKRQFDALVPVVVDLLSGRRTKASAGNTAVAASPGGARLVFLTMRKSAPADAATITPTLRL